MAEHPFDRYGPFTALTKLVEFSSRPLRKSLRVNTLKSSVDDFKKWAKEKGWQIEPVPWCAEAFFIDREDRTDPLGSDLLHLLGHTYIQEAASMLPAALLEVQPGDTVLDMSAAPGSKTTQLAAEMDGKGVFVANDVVPKRLKTLKDALHRSGATNIIVTKQLGQRFGQDMIESFDRVMCDAPCTAQGTLRKDPDALKYTSEHSIKKAAGLQRALLESAVHACKTGGRIVYSTCTLTPEENEEVVAAVMGRYGDQLQVIDPREKELGNRNWDMGKAIEDSLIVQKSLGPNSQIPTPTLRLWPHTYDTEGFFCAVLEKTAPTVSSNKTKHVNFQERMIPRAAKQGKEDRLVAQFGSSFVLPHERLALRDDQLILTTEEVMEFHLPIQNYSLGLPFAKNLKDGGLRITNELASLRGPMATQNVCELSDAQIRDLFSGKDSTCDPELDGDVIIRWKGLNIGVCLARGGKLKNNISRWIVRQSVA